MQFCILIVVLGLSLLTMISNSRAENMECNESGQCMCKPGYYGEDCTQLCPANCTACDRQSGDCHENSDSITISDANRDSITISDESAEQLTIPNESTVSFTISDENRDSMTIPDESTESVTISDENRYSINLPGGNTESFTIPDESTDKVTIPYESTESFTSPDKNTDTIIIPYNSADNPGDNKQDELDDESEGLGNDALEGGFVPEEIFPSDKPESEDSYLLPGTGDTFIDDEGSIIQGSSSSIPDETKQSTSVRDESSEDAGIQDETEQSTSIPDERSEGAGIQDEHEEGSGTSDENEEGSGVSDEIRFNETSATTNFPEYSTSIQNENFTSESIEVTSILTESPDNTTLQEIHSPLMDKNGSQMVVDGIFGHHGETPGPSGGTTEKQVLYKDIQVNQIGIQPQNQRNIKLDVIVGDNEKQSMLPGGLRGQAYFIYIGGTLVILCVVVALCVAIVVKNRKKSEKKDEELFMEATQD